MKSKYYVYVKGNGGQTWLFEDFDGGTKEEAEHCAELMNNGDVAHDFDWKYYAEEG